MGLLSVREVKTQLYFYDDGSFIMRKLPFEDSCLVEKMNGEIVKAWKHFYAGELFFSGYKKIAADGVVLGFGRDFILDPFDSVPIGDHPDEGKPRKGDDRHILKWTARIAEAQRYKVDSKRGNMMIWDKVTMFLGVGFILEILVMFGLKALNG